MFLLAVTVTLYAVARDDSGEDVASCQGQEDEVVVETRADE